MWKQNRGENKASQCRKAWKGLQFSRGPSQIFPKKVTFERSHRKSAGVSRVGTRGTAFRRLQRGKGHAKALRYEGAWCIRGVARWPVQLGQHEDRQGNRSSDLVRPFRSKMWVLSTRVGAWELIATCFQHCGMIWLAFLADYANFCVRIRWQGNTEQWLPLRRTSRSSFAITHALDNCVLVWNETAQCS